MANALFYRDNEGKPVVTVILHDERTTNLEKLGAVISRKLSVATGAIEYSTGVAIVDKVQRGKRKPYAHDRGIILASANRFFVPKTTHTLH